ncbi:MAG: pyruvate:ferredoxin (flavodoxin) oxidoreductase, partial [bacterium]|nr:pyruvate:ferredoxin (flavodoxin) oxidoreductase [bacterium]
SALARQPLPILGDHSDVMAVRNTGFAMLSSTNSQEVMDLSAVSHLATLKAQVPFVNFFDGFRTSHEITKINEISYETLKELLDPEMEYVERFRNRALRPEAPYCKVGAQNPDVYFQGRETVNKYYNAVPGIVQEYMDKVAAKTGRQYHVFDYYGDPEATDIIVAIGSACETISETIDYLRKQGKKVGLVIVRLYRPFASDLFAAAIPETVKRIAVLDRTKEPGAVGEPLYLDVVAALKDRKDITIIGGRYGLSSKEFTPSMVNGVYKHLAGKCTHNFTVGIEDDVTNLSIDCSEEIITAPEGTISCTFWGLGSDGTVGANKDSIKIIGNNTEQYAQGYFVYDSKKSYGSTISHLRFGKNKIRSTYCVSHPDFVACHNPAYIGRFDMIGGIKENGIFLINSEWTPEEAFKHLPEDMQRIIIDRKIKVYTIDALKISKEAGLGARINTVMMTAFFKVSGVLEENHAIELIKKSIKKTYAKKGEEVINMNCGCVDKASENLKEVIIPETTGSVCKVQQLIPEDADEFAKNIVDPIAHLKGDSIPVSHMSYDGSLPTGTARYDKTGIAPQVPEWVKENCIQCNQCVSSCPHAAIRAKILTDDELKDAPATFVTAEIKPKAVEGRKYIMQVYTDDCTGCGVCVETCPAKTKGLVMTSLEDARAKGQTENYKFFDAATDNLGADKNNIKNLGFVKPLFEFSGACAGCGETPYLKMISQLFGERMIVANATGCSSIYSSSFPSIPYTKTKEGRGPAWANSLFEDNAEYGYGMRFAVDTKRAALKDAAEKFIAAEPEGELTAALVKALENWTDKSTDAMTLQGYIKVLAEAYAATAEGEKKELAETIKSLGDYFVDKSVWCIGGDGWAYDIGYGGLYHVVASGKNINILVLDTEVYSNTGGQSSKSTPIGAIAKFASNGKRAPKKNLGFMCMSYGNVYVAQIALGSNRAQAMKAFAEAEAYEGTSIIIAYAPCIAHGINMMKTQTEQKKAVDSGYWPLYRYNPASDKPLTWETPEPKSSFNEFVRGENRYKLLIKKFGEEKAQELFEQAEKDTQRRMQSFKNILDMQK